MKEITLAELSKKPTAGSEVKLAEPETKNTVTESAKINAAREVSISDIAKTLPPKPEEEIKETPVVEAAFNAMTKTIAERKENINKTMPYILENAREIALENEMNNEKNNTVEDTENEEEEVVAYETPDISNIRNDFSDLDEDGSKPEVVNKKPEKETVDAPVDLSKNDLDEALNIIGGDIDEDDFSVNESDISETADEAMERYKKSLSAIKVTKDPIDLSTFKVRQKPVSASTVLNDISSNPYKKKGDWALYHTGRSITLTECDGPELDSLRKTIDNSNNLNKVIASLRFIYNHDCDPNKPTFENWCKHIRTEDIESLYFAMYKVCYSDMNLLGVSCPPPTAKNKKDRGCGKASIVEVPIMSMVKYENDEVKDKFNKILQKESTTEDVTIKSNIIPMSDNFAVAYSEPTLYSTFIQMAALPEEITTKFAALLNSLLYITGFFKIDKETKELIPIEIKVYPNNLNKTIRSKLKVYIEILKSLTNDQYNILISKLNNLLEDPKVTYVNPETECPECGKTIPEEEIESTLSLLFTRAQLVALKSI